MMQTIDPVHFEAIILDNGIPPRPMALEAVSKELRNEAPDLRSLERILSQDVAIAGGLIKMANSSYFGLNRRVRSVMEAMEMMGLRAVGQAVACIALRNAFPNLHLDRFWDASANIAAIAAQLVRSNRWKNLSSEDAYTFGLFRDCGIAIIMQRIPSYVEVLRKANADPTRPFTDIEEDVLPVGHTQVGAMMTQTWWLPEEIADAIRFHHDIDSIQQAQAIDTLHPNCAELIAVVQLAEYLFQQQSGLSLTREWDKLGPTCLALLNVDVNELPELQKIAALALSQNN